LITQSPVKWLEKVGLPFCFSLCAFFSRCHFLSINVTICSELDPFYLLRFDTDADAIQFACNPQQMQDLVATIQDALKQTERELL
jgi:hypothetical protein